MRTVWLLDPPMTRWLVVALVVAVGLLVWSLRSGAAADQRARTFEHLVDSLTAVEQKYHEVAVRDSLKLEAERDSALVREQRLEAERAQALGRASVAAKASQKARDSLLALLDSLGAPHEALDSLTVAHATEIAAKDEIIGKADSVTVVVRSLLMATENALASERAAHQATEQVNGALRAEVGAIRSARRRDRMASALVVVGVLALVLVR